MNQTNLKVNEGEEKEAMKIIAFTFDGSILPVCKKLQEEGNQVVIGMIEMNKNVFTDNQIKNGAYKKEKPEEKEARFKLYEGVLEKMTAESLIKKMKSLKDRGDWFILADSNNCFRFCQEALEMGFINGFFPTEKDRDFEENRMLAKDFVKEYYPDITLQEVKKFDSIDEAKEFLQDTEKRWVLKSLGDNCDTFVPQSEDLEQAKEQLISNLDMQKKSAESDGFILEEMIENPIELTPQVTFYNGEPVYYTLDIENKPIGSSNIGFQVGCAQNLIVHTSETDKLNQIAFPKVVYEMAKDHKGIFVWDIGILVDEKGTMFFTEFCSNRFGWDAFVTELEMSGSVTEYLQKVMQGEDPIIEEFGAGVRVFNLTKHGPSKDSKISLSDSEGIWIYDCYGNPDDYYAVGNMIDLAVCTGCGNNEYDAIKEAYKRVENISIESKFFRPEFDIKSYDYQSSILNRYNYVVSHNLIGYNFEEYEEGNKIEGETIPSN